MRKRAFDKLLREAVLLDANERGLSAMRTPETEPVPEAAKVRFDAALTRTKSGGSGTEKTAEPAPRRVFGLRALAYLASAAACLALVVLVAVAYFKGRGNRIVPGVADPTAAPTAADPTADPISAVTPTPAEDPYAAITPHPSERPAATVAPTEEPGYAITPVPEPTPTPSPIPVFEALTGVWRTNDGIRLVLLPDGAAWVQGDFDGAYRSESLHGAWELHGRDAQIAFFGETPIRSAAAEWDGGVMTLTLADGGTRSATRMQGTGEALALLAQNRDLLERAATALSDGDIAVLNGTACRRNDGDGSWNPIDESTLSADVRAFLALAKERNLSARWEEGEPIVKANAAPYFRIILHDREETMRIWLIYTENAADQFGKEVSGTLLPVAENWYLFAMEQETEE